MADGAGNDYQFGAAGVESKGGFAGRHVIHIDLRQFWKKHAVLIIAAILVPLYTMTACSITAAIVKRNTTLAVTEAVEHRMRGEFQQYLDDQEQAAALARFKSGADSLEMAIQSANKAVAGAISKLSTEEQKLTEAACMAARVLNPAYPNTFEEVVAQAKQWMFYDGTDTTYTARDLELADMVVRPLLERGELPNGLTSEMVYGEWTPTDFVLRDSYKTTSTMRTWRFSK